MKRNIIGQRFGKWTVIKEAGRDKKSNMFYKCVCDCGTIRNHAASTLKNKTTQCKSCYMAEVNKVEDLVGKTFGKWKIVSKTKNIERNEWFYDSICECGTQKRIAGHSLKSGFTTQCHRCRCKTHGMSYTDTFRIWTGILRRCLNPNFKAYKYYGGRGITVCDRWLKFENFFEDMGVRPDGLQIDRIDVDGNYEPSNCRWVTPKVNMNNRRINKIKEN
jgi:hypothetical protein